MFGLNFYSEPVCAAIDIIDLGSKTLVPGTKKCFGEALVDQLGPQTIDPGATLECAPQTCAVNTNGDGWDLEMCTPYVPGGTSGDVPTGGGEGDTIDTDTDPGEDDDKGCAGGGCATDTTGGLAVLMLAAVIPFRRRRRA